MNTVRKTKSKETKVIQLKVIRGESSREASRLVNASWAVVQSALWNSRHFNPSEVAQLKKLIAEHYENGKSIKVTFKDLIERICLAKRYVARKKGRYISKPVDWLNIHYHKGLAGTAAWLQEVKEQRKTVPEYNLGISTLAKGILKYTESPSMTVFYQYRRMLIEQKQQDLLQIFYNTIINLQFLAK
jgi:hypothetical protein